MVWKSQSRFFKPVKRASSILNNLALTDEDAFKITKKIRIRNVQLVPLTVGSYFYQFVLYTSEVSINTLVGQLGSGIISKISDIMFNVGHNDEISEYIHDGNELLILQPVIHNRIDSEASFNFIVEYDIWEEIEDE